MNNTVHKINYKNVNTYCSLSVFQTSKFLINQLKFKKHSKPKKFQFEKRL